MILSRHASQSCRILTRLSTYGCTMSSCTHVSCSTLHGLPESKVQLTDDTTPSPQDNQQNTFVTIAYMVSLVSLTISNWWYSGHDQGILQSICYHTMLPTISHLRLLLEAHSSYCNDTTQDSIVHNSIIDAASRQRAFDARSLPPSLGHSDVPRSWHALAPNHLCMKGYNGNQMASQVSYTTFFAFPQIFIYSVVTI